MCVWMCYCICFFYLKVSAGSPCWLDLEERRGSADCRQRRNLPPDTKTESRERIWQTAFRPCQSCPAGSLDHITPRGLSRATILTQRIRIHSSGTTKPVCCLASAAGKVCWAHRGHSVSHYPDDFLMAVWLDSARNDMPLSWSVWLCFWAWADPLSRPRKSTLTLLRGQTCCL